jgi:hypothetical protein
MQRDEMDAGADILPFQELDEFIAADAQLLQIQLNDIEVPGMLHTRRHIRSDNTRDVAKPLIVQHSTALPAFPKAVAFL